MKSKPGGPRDRSRKHNRRARITTDHDEIREWAELRGAWPAHVRGTGKRGEIGVLRLDFPEYSGEGRLEKLSWDDFFQKFDDANLAFLYHEDSNGGERSNFNKLVKCEDEDEGG